MDPDPLQLPLVLAITSQSTMWIYVISFLLLLLASALISGAEVAFFSLESTDLEDDNDAFPYQEMVAKLLDRPKKLLATILIANNAINISTVLIFSILSETWFAGITTAWMQFALEVVVVTFAILLFGEIFPK
ncbi:MAG: DUF21 domain-containing protein, partial [Nonlabens sp.]|nr:DUF21 domain-containing protein [Nonlabens sp.]